MRIGRRRAGRIARQGGLRLGLGRDELGDVFLVHGAIQGVRGRHRADEDPAPLPACRMSSTGSSETMPNATAPLDTSTPAKLKKPDQTTARLGDIEFV